MKKSELERLAILSEELGEAQQVIGKIIRHGYESHNPFDNKMTTNRKLLEKELGDIQWICGFMIKKGDLIRERIVHSAEEKEKRIEKYLHYNKT